MSMIPRKKEDRVLSIRDLNISFETASGRVNAIRGVRMDLFRGETIAIVGESGSGKSVTVKTIMGILANNGRIDSGTINYTFTNEKGERETVDLTKLTQKEIRYRFNGKYIAMVFQDQGESHEASRRSRHRESGEALQGIPASALRRHAAESRHRNCACLQS